MNAFDLMVNAHAGNPDDAIHAGLSQRCHNVLCHAQDIPVQRTEQYILPLHGPPHVSGVQCVAGDDIYAVMSISLNFAGLRTKTDNSTFSVYCILRVRYLPDLPTGA